MLLRHEVIQQEQEMQNQKRKVEVFTAGCPLCGETLTLVREAVTSCGCDDAKRYGVRAMPAVVVDGELVFEGQITRAQAALLTR